MTIDRGAIDGQRRHWRSTALSTPELERLAAEIDRVLLPGLARLHRPPHRRRPLPGRY